MIIKKFLFLVLALLFSFGASVVKYIVPVEKVKKTSTIQSFTLEKAGIMNFADLQHGSHSSHSSHSSHGSHASHASHASHYSGFVT